MLRWQKLRYNMMHVDIVVALGAFTCMLLDPLKNEYIYMRVAELHNTTKKVLSDCSEANTTNVDHIVSQEVSQWTLYMNLSMFLPAIIAGILVTSWGDKVGRKTSMSVPMCAMLAHSVVLAVVIKLHLPIPTLLLCNFTAGLGGYYMTLIMQGTAYLSDTTTEENRGMRFTILESALGVGGGVAGLSSGYWIEAQGFFNPVICTVVINLSSLLLVPLLLNPAQVKEERELREKSKNSSDSLNCEESSDRRLSADSAFSDVTVASKGYGSCTDVNENKDIKVTPGEKYNVMMLVKRVWRVYTSEYSYCDVCDINDVNVNATKCRLSKCEHGGGYYPGRIWRLWFLMISYDLMMFVNVGCMVFQTIYYLSSPLCFTPVLVGAQLGLKFSLVALSPIVIVVLQKVLKLHRLSIVLVGLVALSSFALVMSFATTHALVFIATTITLLSNPAKPFIQAKISSLASKYEQGAVFALLSSTEVITFLAATLSFLTLYPATLSIYHGFAWLFGAGVVLIPFLLVLTIYIADKRLGPSYQHSEDTTPILS